MFYADSILTFGLLLLVLTIPSIFSALIDKRSPVLAVIILLIGGGMVFYAYIIKPGGYNIEEVPEAILHVIADYIP